MKIYKPDWKPDYSFSEYTELTKEWLMEKGIRTIVSDLDGTLVSHNEGMTEKFEAWYRDNLEPIECALIVASNNEQLRVNKFTEPLKLVGYGKCSKPFGDKVDVELIQKGLNPETTLFLGDQVFTDMWMGNRLGMKTALVRPLGEYEPWVTKIKRPMETALLKIWRIR